MTDQVNATWSLVTITGTINSRHVRTGKDGVVRFSIQNSNGFFYIQCTQCEKSNTSLLRQGARVMVTGRLISFYDPRSKIHQTAIIAQSLAVIRNGRTIQLLRNLKVIANN